MPIALSCDQRDIMMVDLMKFQMYGDFSTNMGGKNDGATLRSLRLMRAEFDFTANLVVARRDIAYRQRRDLADAQSRADGQRKRETITISVTCGLDDAKHATNLVIGEHRCLCHGNDLGSHVIARTAFVLSVSRTIELNPRTESQALVSCLRASRYLRPRSQTIRRDRWKTTPQP
jgi:hypothetical protein